MTLSAFLRRSNHILAVRDQMNTPLPPSRANPGPFPPASASAPRSSGASGKRHGGQHGGHSGTHTLLPRTWDDMTLTSRETCIWRVIPTQHHDEQVYKTNRRILLAQGHSHSSACFSHHRSSVHMEMHAGPQSPGMRMETPASIFWS